MRATILGELLLLCCVLVLVYLVWLHDQQLRELTPLVDRVLLETGRNGTTPDASPVTEPVE